jgi:hypothetical protein
VASGYNLALKAIATTTSFVAKMEFLFGFCQPLYQLLYTRRPVLNRAARTNFPTSPIFGNGDGDCFFVDVQTDIQHVHSHLLFQRIAPCLLR